MKARLARPGPGAGTWLRAAAALALGGALLGSARAETASPAGSACTVVADAPSGRLLQREGECEQRVTPASTFKIALSLMGYDSGYLSDEHLPALPFREGYADWIPAWRATTDPTTWIANSVVWYSQRLTEWLGEQRFRRYVESFQYGNQDLSGDPGKGNGLTEAWLTSSLAISPLEQLEFLRKVVTRRLPVSARAYDMTDRITAVGGLPGGWDVHGKSGTGWRRNADGSADRTRQIGWFVGWAKNGERAVVFARCLRDEAPQPASAARRAREGVMRDLPAILDAP
jgi:beta-lactamase class D